MPVMDQTCFISASVAHINFISITGFEGEYDEAWFRKLYYDHYLEKYPKFSYKVTELFGDLYYKKISKDEAFKKAWYFESDPNKTLKSKYELECFVRDNMNIKMPLDGP